MAEHVESRAHTECPSQPKRPPAIPNKALATLTQLRKAPAVCLPEGRLESGARRKGPGYPGTFSFYLP